MIDFHSHILPGIDDGSNGIEETERLLHMEYEQGVEQVVLTPHFYAQKDSVNHFMEHRRASFDEIEKLRLTEKWLPNLHIGAEVYYFPGMGNADMLPDLCIQGTRVLLLEMPFVQWNKEIVEDVRKIIDKQKLVVVLAHTERYIGFQKDKSFFNQVLSYPVYLQFNAGALQNRKKRHFIKKCIKDGRQIVFGSDSHNTHHRIPNVEEARKWVKDKFGIGIWNDIDARGKRILTEYETEA